MRVAQMILPGASAYEMKSQRIDAAALVEAGHEVVGVDVCEIAHLYAPAEFDASIVRDLAVPYVASGRPKRSFRRAPEPRVVVTPEVVPEAVEEAWFDAVDSRDNQWSIIASFGPHRRGVKNAIEQTVARLHRFREDIEWHVFNEPPTPSDLTGVDAWVDPATDDLDYDGFVAEALVLGLPVIAARTPINLQRTEKGHNAFLVPANDANELAHAILTGLFKAEVAGVKIEAARKTASKFRPRQRLRVLERVYQGLLAVGS